MTQPDFSQSFQTLYDKAVALYAQGRREADTYFTVEEKAWLSANGLTDQHLYDYAEDHNNYGEPGYDNALGIELVRRDYFLTVQHGKPSGVIADPGTWPAKTETVRGIEWLPRILPKARAKLRGELPSSTMYGCSGDRRFFKTNAIQPAVFLTVVWRNLDHDQAVIDWVVNRSAAKA